MAKETEGSFIAAVNESSYSVQKSGDYYIVGQLPSHEMYLSRDSGTTVLVIFNILLFGVIFFVIAKLVQSIVINGIYRVNNSLEKITRGNLNEVVSVRTSKEFASLSAGINTTVNALKEAINEAASRIDTELSFAKAIQPRPFLRSSQPSRNEKISIFTLGCIRPSGRRLLRFLLSGRKPSCSRYRGRFQQEFSFALYSDLEVDFENLYALGLP